MTTDETPYQATAAAVVPLTALFAAEFLRPKFKKNEA